MGELDKLNMWNHQVVIRHPDGTETNIGLWASVRPCADEIIRQSIIAWEKRAASIKEYRALVDKILRDHAPKEF